MSSGSMRCFAMRVALTALTLHAASAYWITGSGQTPEARALGAVVHVSPMTFADVGQVVSLSAGYVLIVDRIANRVFRADADLRNGTSIVDSAALAVSSGTSSPVRILPFLGDSSLVYVPGLRSFLVLDPAGMLARDMAGFPFIAQGAPDPFGFSPRFGLLATVHQTVGAFRDNAAALEASRTIPRPPVGSARVERKFPDSAFVIAMDPRSRALDTLARLLNGRATVLMIQPRGNTFGSEAQVFPFVDQPVVMADGSIAIVRSAEYRVHWVSADREIQVSPRIPYAWQRVTDAQKQAKADSVNAVRWSAYQERLAHWLSDSATAGGRGPITRGTQVIRGTLTSIEGIRPRPTPPPPIGVEEVPDFLSPIGPGSVMADADNRLWIRPQIVGGANSGEVIWDVVDRTGRLVDRVWLPRGDNVVGFSPGHVFLASRDGSRMTLKKVAIATGSSRRIPKM